MQHAGPIIIIIIIRIYYGAAQPVLSSALQYNNYIGYIYRHG